MNFMTTQPILPENFLAAKPGRISGAWATFFGLVRDHHDGRAVKRLHYECYERMANSEIRRIREEMMARHGLDGLNILHRVGTLEIGEIAIAVACSSAHRAEAFAACEETVEKIKYTVPIWKKEFYEDGSSAWVAGCAHPAGSAA